MKQQIVAAWICLFLGACGASQTHPVFNDEGVGSSEGHFTDAVIEFAGPAARWAGPAGFRMRVTASSGAYATFAIEPAALFDVSRKIKARITGEVRTFPHVQVPTAQIREQLERLAEKIQVVSQSFQGCLAPVRLVLTRDDGTTLERRGCRGADTWVTEVSFAVHELLKLALIDPGTGSSKEAHFNFFGKPGK